MVNPIKFIGRATGLSRLFDEPPEAAAPAAAPAAAQSPVMPAATAPPEPAPVVGQDPAPRRAAKRARQVAPAIIGNSISANSGVGSSSGGKTLLGQ